MLIAMEHPATKDHLSTKTASHTTFIRCEGMASKIQSKDATEQAFHSPLSSKQRTCRRQQRKVINFEDKARIIAQAEAGRKKASIAKESGIAASSLSTILKSKDAITAALASGKLAKRKKMTQPAHEELEKAVVKSFVETRAKKIPLSGDVVRHKALDYACVLGINDFKASLGWLNRFKGTLK